MVLHFLPRVARAWCPRGVIAARGNACCPTPLIQLAASRSCRGSSFAYRRMKASLPPLLDGLSAGQNQPFPFLEYENWAAVKDQSQVSICQCHRKLTINLLPHVERLLTSPKEDRPSRGVSSTYVWTRLLKDVVTCRKHQPSEGSLTIK